MAARKLPNELVVKIFEFAWLDDMRTGERIQSMKVFPLINRQFKACYAEVSALHVFLPTLSFAFYFLALCRQPSASKIYAESAIPSHTRSLTCAVDFLSDNEDPASSVYTELVYLHPIGFSVLGELLPQVPCLRLCSRALFRDLRHLGLHDPAAWDQKEILSEIEIPIQGAPAQSSVHWLVNVVHFFATDSDNDELPSATDISEARRCLSSVYRALLGGQESVLWVPPESRGYSEIDWSSVITSNGITSVRFSSSWSRNTENRRVSDLLVNILRSRTDSLLDVTVWIERTITFAVCALARSDDSTPPLPIASRGRSARGIYFTGV